MPENLALILIGILALLDVVTTVRALRQPHLHEANGLLAWLMRLGPIWIVLKLAATAGALWLLRDQSVMINVWAAWGVAAVYAFVVWRNYRLGS